MLDRVEGPVVVRVKVSATGCMERAEVTGSSGADELDEAALLLAEQYSYLPAAKDGKAISASMPFKIQFRLND